MDARAAPRVKNRAPAPIQITAEQLLREATERPEDTFKSTRSRIESYEELAEYSLRKRTEFEDRVRRTRTNLREWMQYALWEASQGEFERARSIFERALDVEPTAVSLWLKYTETELKARNVNHARNLFDRAVTLLPRISQLWYKYIHLEELLGNVLGARAIFERWITWNPDDKAWQAYIKLEERYAESDRASAVFERWITHRPEPRNFVKWAKWEEERGQPTKARQVFQTALEFFGDEEEQIEKAQAVYNHFAKMETRLKEFARAQVIYKYALSRLPRSKSAALYDAYTRFEKQHGDRSSVESTVLAKRRIHYESELETHGGSAYDTWFDYIRLEEDAYRTEKEDGTDKAEEQAALARVNDLYERAIANVPPGAEKRFWRRYIYLWLNYALFQEIDAQNLDKAEAVYKAIIELLPHHEFTFAKLWIQYARFELRRNNISRSRKILGTAIGKCPKAKLFSGYIKLEIQLREWQRVRTLFQKKLQFDPTNSSSWIEFAMFETEAGEFARAVSIYEMAISQPSVDMPENIWKSFIDFYTGTIPNRSAARALYERLLRKTCHVKVWIAFAEFEASDIEAADEDQVEDAADVLGPVEELSGDNDRARKVWQKAYEELRSRGMRDERVILLDRWQSFEADYGDEAGVQKVQAMLPRQVKKWRKSESGDMEEYWDLVFPDDEKAQNPASFKFLQMAQAFKQRQMEEELASNPS